MIVTLGTVLFDTFRLPRKSVCQKVPSLLTRFAALDLIEEKV